MLVLLSDMKGIVILSSFITPVLIIGLLLTGIFIIASKNIYVFSATGDFHKITSNWLFSTLLYVGYNSIIAIVVMCGLLPQLKTKKAASIGGIAGGFMLCAIAMVLNIVMVAIHPDSLTKEIPLLSITEKYSFVFSGLYALILWLAMFISALTSGYCLIDRMNSKIHLNRKWMIVLVCILITPLSKLGFSNLISKIYPMFGYIGLFIIIVILIQSLKIKPYKRIRKLPEKSNCQ
jgi:uncharacterized membrane protein YkvI